MSSEERWAFSFSQIGYDFYGGLDWWNLFEVPVPDDHEAFAAAMSSINGSPR